MKEELFELLIRLGDDHLVLGHRVSEWCGHAPMLEEDLALCVKYKVPMVITSLGARTDVFEAIHSYGGIVFHDVIDNGFAKKAVEKVPTRWSPLRPGRAAMPARSRPSP